MNRKKVIITGAAACAGVVLIGTGLWFWLGRDKGAGSENVVYVNSVDSLMNPGNTSGILNRFAGVVETQESLEIPASQDQTVKEIYVEEGQEVQVGTPLFIYDTEKTSEELEKAQLELERISNEIGNKYNELAALEKEKKTADKSAQLDYTIQIQEAQLEVKRRRI
ncbi:MAG: biotin/lipoyl-binding protein [Lachnospiraceae bacterium]